MKVLVLGHNGMLGNAVCKHLNSCSGFEILTIDSRWSTEDFVRSLLSFNGDYVINCIGAIPQKTTDFKINYELPIWLDENVNCRVIHQDTDSWKEKDDYTLSKIKASNYLALHGSRTKIIKTCVIGHGKDKVSLLDWFLNSNDEVFGYTECYWNGNTTLQWAKQCIELMVNWKKYAKNTTMSTECISKYDLLNVIKEVYDKKIVIHKDSKLKINRCLRGQVEVPTIKKQLQQLKEFYG